MNSYILNTKDLKEIAESIEKLLYKQKLKQFSYDPSYKPQKTEIPVEILKKALNKHKL